MKVQRRRRMRRRRRRRRRRKRRKRKRRRRRRSRFPPVELTELCFSSPLLRRIRNFSLESHHINIFQ